jgi:hypothetical protein
LNINEHILKVYHPALDYGLKEDTYEPDHSVFVDFSLSGVSALIHAVLQEYLYELLR